MLEIEIKEWGKIKLCESKALRDKVRELNAQGINTNFIFIKYLGKSQGIRASEYQV